MSNRSILIVKFANGQTPPGSDFADLINNNFNLKDPNVFNTNIGYTMVSNNITNATGSPYTQNLSSGNVFYFGITSGTGNFTFDYRNATVGLYFFIFCRAANLAIRNITWASSKYASAFGALPVLTTPTSIVEGKHFIMGIYDSSRMIVVQQASILNN